VHAEGRAQLATSLVETVVGLLLIVAVTTSFTVLPVGSDADEASEVALDRLAGDALAVLAAGPPTNDGPSRLASTCDEAALDAERAALADSLDAALPDPLSYRLVAPGGSVGAPRPDGVPTGRATRTTAGCRVTLWVWYV
jgi:hypothetical protein